MSHLPDTVAGWLGALGLLATFGAALWRSTLWAIGWIKRKALEDIRETGVAFFGIDALSDAVHLVQVQLAPNGGLSLVDQVAAVRADLDQIKEHVVKVEQFMTMMRSQIKKDRR